MSSSNNTKVSDVKAIPLNVDIPQNPCKQELLLSEFEKEVEELTCPICQNLVWNPVHCSKCTNLICKACIDQWLLNSQKCPLCNAIFISNNLVNLVKNQLSKLKFRCYFFKINGEVECKNIISYFDYENHIKKCEFFPHKCALAECKFVSTKNKTIAHYETCVYNLVTCPSCKNKIKKNILESHLDVCKNLCIRCRCLIKAKDFEKHQSDVLECIKLLNIAHKTEIEKKNEEINELKRNLVTKTIEKDSNDKLIKENKDLSLSVKVLKEKELDQTSQITLLEKRIKNQELINKGIDILMAEYKTTIETLTSENKQLSLKAALTENKKTTESEKTTTQTNLVFRYFALSTQLEVYYCDKRNLNSICLTINPLVLPYKVFWKNSATLNYKDNFYISGGECASTLYCQFIKYDSSSNDLVRLNDMIIPKSNHSLVYCRDSIYAIGGKGTLTTEKYSLTKLDWTEVGNLNLERSNPMLFSTGKYIYCFFGISNGLYTDTVERLNVETIIPKWEILATFPTKKENTLGRIFSGIAKKSETEIIFIGGKNCSGIIQSSISFNLERRYFLTSSNSLKEPQFFRESLLINLKEKQLFGHFAYKESSINADTYNGSFSIVTIY